MSEFSLRSLPSLKTISLPCWHLIQAVETADAAGADTSETNLRRRLTLPGFDPLTDQIACPEPGR